MAARGETFLLKVDHGLFSHEIRVPASATLGDLKRALVEDTSVQPQDQRIFFRGKEIVDADAPIFDAGVRDRTRLLLQEEDRRAAAQAAAIGPQPRPTAPSSGLTTAAQAIAGVRATVDTYEAQVAALRKDVYERRAVEPNAFAIQGEVLMRELLKLDGIVCNENERALRKTEVRRVQMLVEEIDRLKGIHVQNNSTTSSSTPAGALPPLSSTQHQHHHLHHHRHQHPAPHSSQHQPHPHPPPLQPLPLQSLPHPHLHSQSHAHAHLPLQQQQQHLMPPQQQQLSGMAPPPLPHQNQGAGAMTRHLSSHLSGLVVSSPGASGGDMGVVVTNQWEDFDSLFFSSSSSLASSAFPAAPVAYVAVADSAAAAVAVAPVGAPPADSAGVVTNATWLAVLDASLSNGAVDQQLSLAPASSLPAGTPASARHLPILADPRHPPPQVQPPPALAIAGANVQSFRGSDDVAARQAAMRRFQALSIAKPGATGGTPPVSLGTRASRGFRAASSLRVSPPGVRLQAAADAASSSNPSLSSFPSSPPPPSSAITSAIAPAAAIASPMTQLSTFPAGALRLSAQSSSTTGLGLGGLGPGARTELGLGLGPGAGFGGGLEASQRSVSSPALAVVPPPGALSSFSSLTTAPRSSSSPRGLGSFAHASGPPAAARGWGDFTSPPQGDGSQRQLARPGSVSGSRSFYSSGGSSSSSHGSPSPSPSSGTASTSRAPPAGNLSSFAGSPLSSPSGRRVSQQLSYAQAPRPSDPSDAAVGPSAAAPAPAPAGAGGAAAAGGGGGGLRPQPEAASNANVKAGSSTSLLGDLLGGGMTYAASAPAPAGAAPAAAAAAFGRQEEAQFAPAPAPAPSDNASYTGWQTFE